MKNKKAKIIISTALVISLIIAYSFMYSNINSLYPQNEKVIYNQNEIFEIQGANARIISSKFINKDEILNDKVLTEALNSNSDYMNEDDFYLALIDMELENVTNNPVTVDLTAFHLESGSFSLQGYYPLMLYYNEYGMYVELKNQETKKLKFVVPISPSQFNNQYSNSILNKEYFLVYSLYPQKLMVSCNF